MIHTGSILRNHVAAGTPGLKVKYRYNKYKQTQLVKCQHKPSKQSPT